MKSVKDLMENNRKEELIAIFRFIFQASYEECARIIEEIRCVHNNLIFWDASTKRLIDVESVSMNGECIQLNGEG